MPYQSLYLAIAASVAIALAASTARCAEPQKARAAATQPEFEADADANTFAGPAPLRIEFSATSSHGHGRVRFHWDFDDGTEASGPKASHTFAEPGWYLVKMRASDAAGRSYEMTLTLHAWRPDEWTRMLAHPDPAIVARALRELQEKTGVKIPGVDEEPGHAPAPSDRPAVTDSVHEQPTPNSDSGAHEGTPLP